MKTLSMSYTHTDTGGRSVHEPTEMSHWTSAVATDVHNVGLSTLLQINRKITLSYTYDCSVANRVEISFVFMFGCLVL